MSSTRICRILNFAARVERVVIAVEILAVGEALAERGIVLHVFDVAFVATVAGIDFGASEAKLHSFTGFVVFGDRCTFAIGQTTSKITPTTISPKPSQIQTNVALFVLTIKINLHLLIIVDTS